MTVGKGPLERKRGWRCERSPERFVCGCVQEQLNALGMCVKLLDRSTQNYLRKIEDNRSVYESRRESQKKPVSSSTFSSLSCQKIILLLFKTVGTGGGERTVRRRRKRRAGWLCLALLSCFSHDRGGNGHAVGCNL